MTDSGAFQWNFSRPAKTLLLPLGNHLVLLSVNRSMRKRWKQLLLAFGLICALITAAALGLFKMAERHVAQQLAPPDLQPFNPPRPLPYLSFTGLDGKVLPISSLRGKVVFLDLWGTWCIQCVAEMPTVQALYNKFRNDPNVAFVIASRLDSPAAVRAYARRHRYDLPFYIIDDRDVPPSMQLGQYPETFLISRNGNLVAQHTGGANWSANSVVKTLKQLEATPF